MHAFFDSFAFSLVAVMSSRIVLNLRTLRQGPSDEDTLSTGIGFELGALSATRRSAYPGTTHHGAGRAHLSVQDPTTRSQWTRTAPSSDWPSSDSKEDSGDGNRLHTTSVAVTIQVDVHRAVDVDEFDEDSADDSRWRGNEKKPIGE